MKKCAMECMERHNGVLPDTYEELLKLPGIGAYTAGAIASIAYKRVFRQWMAMFCVCSAGCSSARMTF